MLLPTHFPLFIASNAYFRIGVQTWQKNAYFRRVPRCSKFFLRSLAKQNPGHLEMSEVMYPLPHPSHGRPRGIPHSYRPRFFTTGRTRLPSVMSCRDDDSLDHQDSVLWVSLNVQTHLFLKNMIQYGGFMWQKTVHTTYLNHFFSRTYHKSTIVVVFLHMSRYQIGCFRNEELRRSQHHEGQRSGLYKCGTWGSRKWILDAITDCINIQNLSDTYRYL